MRSCRQPSYRLTRALVAAALAWSACGPAGHALAQFGPGPIAKPDAVKPADAGPKAAITPAERERIAAELDTAYKAVRAAAREMPRGYDPASIAEQAGRDPAKLFAWVRDNTYYVPYQGNLRGPAGVMMDRLGNALDRSLLLAGRLRSAGVPVRLARATLTVEQAQQLAAKIRPAPADRDAAPAHEAGRAQTAAGKLIEASTALAKRQADALIASAAPFKAAGEPTAESNLTDALRDHWWVQVEQDGKWTDYDPLLPDAQPGAAPLAAPAATIVTDKEGVFPLPAADRHEVGVRIVVEQWKGGKLSESPVLTHTLRPAEMLGKRVTFGHFPGGMLKNIQYAADAEAEKKFKAAVQSQPEWVPVLTVGPARVFKSSFTTAGQVIETPQIDPRGMLASSGAKALGAFAGGLGGEESPATKDGGVLTAEWIDYEIRTPGRPAQKARRRVFDLIGPAARAAGKIPATMTPDELSQLNRGLALLGQTEVLLLPCDLSADYVGNMVVEADLKASAAWLDVARRLDAIPADQAARRITAATAADGAARLTPAHLYALHRRAFSPDRGSIYVDSANVVNYRRFLQADAEGTLGLYELMDLAHNPVAVLPGAKVDAFAARLRQGVADTVAELAALAPTGDRLSNTAGVFDAIGEKAPAPIVVRAAGDEKLAALGLTADVKARIDADLAAGNVVVLPSAPAVSEGGHKALAWWRVDPKTGATIGVNENGFLAAMTEKEMNETVPGTTPWQMTKRELSEIPTEAAYEYVHGGGPKVMEGLLKIRQMQASICNALGRALPAFRNGPPGPLI